MRSHDSHEITKLNKTQKLSNKISQYKALIGGGIYVGLIDQSSEGRFLAKKEIGKYLMKSGKQREQLQLEINLLSRPIITIDITLLSKCKSSVISGSRQIKVLESGGVLFHTEKVGAKCDLRSSIFSECSTTTVSGSTSTSTNFAPNIISGDETIPFELLWERENGIGVLGSGILIVYGGAEPTIKAKGTQFNKFIFLQKRIIQVPKKVEFIHYWSSFPFALIVGSLPPQTIKIPLPFTPIPISLSQSNSNGIVSFPLIILGAKFADVDVYPETVVVEHSEKILDRKSHFAPTFSVWKRTPPLSSTFIYLDSEITELLHFDSKVMSIVIIGRESKLISSQSYSLLQKYN
ncbi:MAG: hypothetical protein EZS28_029468 [Streblomastix strix]|uniref:Uncharacterized protein n=1 Tax=Streblomastix strix TaxID=222440 RepID=A0A5J4UWB5_9EUKA|nr:MAG: hypothetical protein EZS28_029468 [Streblomastix strix]